MNSLPGIQCYCLSYWLHSLILRDYHRCFVHTFLVSRNSVYIPIGRLHKYYVMSHIGRVRWGEFFDRWPVVLAAWADGCRTTGRSPLSHFLIWLQTVRSSWNFTNTTAYNVVVYAGFQNNPTSKTDVVSSILHFLVSRYIPPAFAHHVDISIRAAFH